MATGHGKQSAAPVSQTMKTEILNVSSDVIQNPEFQEFISKLEDSQHVLIKMNQFHEIVSINGKTTSVDTCAKQIQHKINKVSSGESNPEGKPEKTKKDCPNPTKSDTIELSVSQNNFFEEFGQEILSKIRKEPGVKSAQLVSGKMQISGDNAATTKMTSYVENFLYEKVVPITCGLKEHLERIDKGCWLKDFVNRHRVGTSFQKANMHVKNKGINTPHRDGIRGRGRGYPNLSKLSLNDRHKNKEDHDDSEEHDRHERHDDDDDDGENMSQPSDSDASSLFNFPSDFSNRATSNDNAQQRILVSLCSDSLTSLNSAIEELQSYTFHIKSWALKDQERIFILKQQQRGKPVVNNMSRKEESKQIRFYFLQAIKNPLMHIFIHYTRGVWHVQISGFKTDVDTTVLKMKNYLNDVVQTEVQVPISAAMAYFLETKASPDINRLSKIYNIQVKFFAPRRVVTFNNDDDDNNNNHCLKLFGPVSRIDSAHMEIQNFLENLSEKEQSYPREAWNIARDIATRIRKHLKQKQQSDDFEAIIFVKLYDNLIERQHTAPKVTFTVVSFKEETTKNVVQQCEDIIHGYIVWKPSLDMYNNISDALFVKRRPSIIQFQKQWDTYIQLQNENHTVVIPASSFTIAEEIKEALQGLATGKMDKIERKSVIIPIQRITRRFANSAIQTILNEARAQKIHTDSRNPAEIAISGCADVINLVEEKIKTIIKDTNEKLIRNSIKLPLAESELIRGNSYKLLTRIEQNTNTSIRDVKVDAKTSTSNINDDTDVTLACVVNNRGQTILVKKGDITKAKDVDAIVNAANGALRHPGGVDKAIFVAAGPELDQERKYILAENNGLAIPPGRAVKTTAGRLPYKGIIHAIGPQYSDGHHNEHSLLFSTILSSLRLAENEQYHSIAMPAISAATYGFPLQNCTNIVIRAIKQFFADFPNSHLRKVILLDIDDAACNSFTREIVNDHTNTDVDQNNDMMTPNLTPLTAKWCWLNDDGWEIYDDTQTRQIEEDFQRYLQNFVPSKLRIYPDNLTTGTIVCYTIHFDPSLKQKLKINPNALNNRLVCGHQRNVETGGPREIIREPITTKTQIISETYHPKPLDVYHSKVQSEQDEWNIFGINKISVKQAEKEIHELIASSKISEPFTVNLTDNIEVHKQLISNIANQQFIHIDFQRDQTGNLLLQLKGFPENLQRAKLQIMSYVQDILAMAANRKDSLDIPTEWGEQEEQCILVQLPINHPDFIRIENRMKETLRNFKIEKIERIQNLRLWNHYTFRYRTLQQELSHRPDFEIEKELFHGTGTAAPRQIYEGEHGFDFTFCEKGLWGNGLYFAVNAAYSCKHYAHKLQDGKRQVFLARVLTGESFDYKDENNPGLRQAPKKNEKVSEARYNSVTGETGGSRVYVGVGVLLTHTLKLLFVSSTSYNQPKFCPTAVWNQNGMTIANRTTVGYYPVDFHHQVMKILLNNTNMTKIIAAGTGTKGYDSNELNQPMGIFVDDDNFDLYVADSRNNRIQLILFIHFIVPFLANLFSALFIIFGSAQQRSKVQKRQIFKEHVYQQMKNHKQLLITPAVLLILALPRLVMSLLSECINASNYPWLFLFGYFIAFTPALLAFTIFGVGVGVDEETVKANLTHTHTLS
ncbi:hypothetical protein I4U23_022445 [Adineta vaga]|nr:hypothetical protein I4U23_022445 [Adineta vaga]